MFLFMHAALGRGDATRNMQLADMFVWELKHVGPDPCTAMVSVVRQGKTNQVCGVHGLHSVCIDIRVA